MAKTSKIVRNEQRKNLVEKYAAKRAALKETIRNPKSSDEDKDKAVLALHKLPRNSSYVRVVHRCQLTGRPRGNYRRFGLSRIAFRELALQGKIPGITKSSW